jgi:hypothetical protein
MKPNEFAKKMVSNYQMDYFINTNKSTRKMYDSEAAICSIIAINEVIEEIVKQGVVDHLFWGKVVRELEK